MPTAPRNLPPRKAATRLSRVQHWWHGPSRHAAGSTPFCGIFPLRYTGARGGHSCITAAILNDAAQDVNQARKACSMQGFRVIGFSPPRGGRTKSGRPDSNRGPPAPKAGALPSCATPRLLRRTEDIRTRREWVAARRQVAVEEEQGPPGRGLGVPGKAGR